MGGAAWYYFANLSSFDSLKEELSLERSKLEAANLTLEEEKNASDASIADLLKQISKVRQEEESLLEVISASEEELAFLTPKLEKLGELSEQAKEALASEKSKVAELVRRMQILENQVSELKATKESRSSRLAEATEVRQAVEAEWTRIDANYSSLSRLRQSANDSFSLAFKAVAEQSVRPFHLFYDEGIEASIESLSPKDNGFFVKKGYEEGIESDFCFLVRLDDEWNEMPFFVHCSLSQKRHSFLRIEGGDDNWSDKLSPGKKLFLIRTGELTSSSDLNDESPLAKTKLFSRIGP